MNKEQIAAFAQTLSEAADSIEEWAAYADKYFQDKHDLQGDLARYRGEAAKLTEVAAQLEKAPEPHSYWVEWSGHEDISMGTHLFELPADTSGLDEVVPLYTFPPEVADMQKQNAELLQHKATDLLMQVRALQAELHSFQSIKDVQHSVLKANFDDACKMLKDAQAQNNLLQAAPPFTSLPNPDLDVIEKALNLAAGLSLCVTVSEYEKIKSAIAALKRLKGE